MTLIGVLTTATLLTLLVIPVFYTLFDDARLVLTAAMKRALRSRKSTPAFFDGHPQQAAEVALPEAD